MACSEGGSRGGREVDLAVPLKLPSNAPNALHTALEPLVDGDSLVAVRVYYVSTTNDGALEVGVVERGGSRAFREALTEVIREELGGGRDGGRRAYPLPGMTIEVN